MGLELESDLEERVVVLMEELGGLALKLTNNTSQAIDIPGEDCFRFPVRGCPDRTCLFPNGQIAFVELKRPGKGKASPHQKTWRRSLNYLGHPVIMSDNMEVIEPFLRNIAHGFKT